MRAGHFPFPAVSLVSQIFTVVHAALSGRACPRPLLPPQISSPQGTQELPALSRLYCPPPRHRPLPFQARPACNQTAMVPIWPLVKGVRGWVATRLPLLQSALLVRCFCVIAPPRLRRQGGVVDRADRRRTPELWTPEFGVFHAYISQADLRRVAREAENHCRIAGSDPILGAPEPPSSHISPA